MEPLRVVGAGEIGRRFVRGAEASGRAVTVLRRGFTMDELGPPGTPLLLCMREQDLAGALAAVPVERGGDLVLVQNGYLDELAQRYPGHTRAVLWFTAKGDFFRSLWPSPVGGPRAALVASLLEAAGLEAELCDPATARRHALEKAAWSCVVGPALTAWGTDFAEALRTRRSAVDAVARESVAVSARAYGVAVREERVRALLEQTVEPLGWMRGGAHALAQRNGWVCERGAALGVPTPENDAVVRAVRERS